MSELSHHVGARCRGSRFRVKLDWDTDVSELAGFDITVVEANPSTETFARFFGPTQQHMWVSM